MNTPPAKPFQYQLWINGKEEPSKSAKTFDRRSPAHDVVVGVYPLAGNEETDLAVAAARRAFDEGPNGRPVSGITRPLLVAISPVIPTTRWENRCLAWLSASRSGSSA